ncbi:P-loop containing nucleoside triphosphate hydrolase protein [Cytidiella melzeri]|nr:P-loop containing nucleoside triphosphate hydrolase protein [Cytidiella melzeri]
MLLHLRGLNEAQTRAVMHPPITPLQILAGPGSGKTRVLTSRIVHFIAVHGIPPASICAVTFTNKAANEMRERLTKALGKEVVSLIKLGTFHSLCARFLRKHASLIGVEGNFTVCDADESKKIIAKCLKPYKKALAARGVAVAESAVQSKISKAKANGLAPKDLLDKCLASTSNAGSSKGQARAMKDEESDIDDNFFDAVNALNVPDEVAARIYSRYQQFLHDSNSLDFDDLLVYGVRLFKNNKDVTLWCQHILVDEFQDTNTMQYELMRYIASVSRCLTVVGDPDQSIYGWRSAEVKNLANMQRDFAGTEQILLEQNYRSTGSILAASIAVISQDKSRIQKTLLTTHASGPKPTLCGFRSAEDEASAIAIEIKRLVASTGSMLGYNDFVILLRYNALSRVFESALQREAIPSRILGGHRFFERLEVKDLLAYLQLLDNPRFVPAFTRIINVPGRNIGDKSIAEILSTAVRLKISPLDVVERIHDDKIPDIRPPLKRKIEQFVRAIKTLRGLTAEWETPAALIRELLSLIQYEEYLKKSQKDWQSRWENVQELINFASELEKELPTFIANAQPSDPLENEDWGDVITDEYDEEELDDLGFVEAKKLRSNTATEAITPLRAFLQMTMLSTDTETEENEDQKKKDRVTISTCHAAKGLEWPVVFVPAVESGIFPATRAEDVEEERRLLYVACTRAQCLLYLTHATSRMNSGVKTQKELSTFIPYFMYEPQATLVTVQPVLDASVRTLFSTMLGRAVPAEADVLSRLAELESSGKIMIWPARFSLDSPPETINGSHSDAQFLSNDFTNDQSHPSEHRASTTFVSARSAVYQNPSSSSAISAPLLPLRTVPSRAAFVSTHIDLLKSAALIPRRDGQNSSRVPLEQKPKASSTELIALWLHPKPRSLPAKDVGEVRSMMKPCTKKPASIGSTALTRNQSRTQATAYSSKAFSSSTDTLALPVEIPVSVPGSSATPAPMAQAACDGVATTFPKQNGGKRRLGMSRAVLSYPNKKFKSPA